MAMSGCVKTLEQWLTTDDAALCIQATYTVRYGSCEQGENEGMPDTEVTLKRSPKTDGLRAKGKYEMQKAIDQASPDRR